jgi:rhodanese-related sulfurtransferase
MRSRRAKNLFTFLWNLVLPECEGRTKMYLTLAAICVSAMCLSLVIWIKRTADRREMEQHSITPEALHTLLATNQEVLLFDVRQPLDLLARYEIIPGAKRIPPREVLENPSLIPKEKDSIVYCTCPSDKTSRAILHRVRALDFLRIKFLKGGLAAWKAKGYPVEPYNEPFHLDTAT